MDLNKLAVEWLQLLFSLLLGSSEKEDAGINQAVDKGDDNASTVKDKWKRLLRTKRFHKLAARTVWYGLRALILDDLPVPGD